MPSDWNMFVKKIYEEGKEEAKKTKTEYSFKQALKEASKRKGEMGSVSNVMPKSMKKSKTMKKSKSMKKGKKMGKKSKTSKRRH